MLGSEGAPGGSWRKQQCRCSCCKPEAGRGRGACGGMKGQVMKAEGRTRRGKQLCALQQRVTGLSAGLRGRERRNKAAEGSKIVLGCGGEVQVQQLQARGRGRAWNL